MSEQNRKLMRSSYIYYCFLTILYLTYSTYFRATCNSHIWTVSLYKKGYQTNNNLINVLCAGWFNCWTFSLDFYWLIFHWLDLSNQINSLVLRYVPFWFLNYFREPVPHLITCTIDFHPRAQGNLYFTCILFLWIQFRLNYMYMYILY